MAADFTAPQVNAGAGDIVSLVFQNAGSAALEGGIATLGQVFQQGDLPPGATLTAHVGGVAVAVQVDVKNRHEDGSVKMAILSIAREDLAANQSVEVVLGRATAAAESGAALDLAAASLGHSSVIDLAIGGRAPIQVDVLAALRQAIADGTADFWQQGPLTSQARVEIEVPNSAMRLVFDVTAYKGGGLSVEAQINNDRTMEAVGGRQSYTIAINFDGEEVRRETVSQGQYQNWHTSFGTDGGDGGQGLGSPTEGWLNIRHDIAYIQNTGAVPAYDLSIGINNKTLTDYGTKIASDANWGEPLYGYGVTKTMSISGGRADIGITTAHNANWLISQDARAAEMALGQAEAASAAPWHFWDAANDTWLNTDDYPLIWADNRAGLGRAGDPASKGLTQYQPNDTGWELTVSHQPNLSLIPYLLTGERWMLDNLNAQASWSVLFQWPDVSRLPGGVDQLVDFTQMRAAAWTMREVDGAAFANPDGSKEQAFFASVAEENWDYIIAQIPKWTTMQGEAYGWMPGLHQARLTPWQQDFFALTVIQAVERGSEKALTVLEWMSNFLIGRFMNEAAGFEARDGMAMDLIVTDATGNWWDNTGTWHDTWAEIGASTVAWNWSNTNDGWSQSNGYYGQLALATLAGIYRVTGNEEAKEAYLKLLAERPPYTDLESYRADPTYAITIPGAIQNPPAQEFPASEIPQAPAAFLDADGMQIAVRLSGDAAAGGNAWAAISVNGYELWRGEVTAGRGGFQDVVLGRVKPDAVYQITARLLNDTMTEDRSLYVENVLVDGVATNSFHAVFWQGASSFNVAVGDAELPAPTVPVIGTGADVVRFALAGNSWREHSKVVVFVDGKQVGDARSVLAQNSLGQLEYLEVRGDFASGAHSVSLQFPNDIWGGSGAKDRGIWVKAVTFNGAPTAYAATLANGGDRMDFRLADGVVLPQETADTGGGGTGGGGGGGTPQPPTDPALFGSGPDTLRVGLASDFWNGPAVFDVLLDGVRLGSGAASANNKLGNVGYIEIKGDFTVGSHTLVIRFTNDAWGGSLDLDRNLHIKSIALNGTDINRSGRLTSNGDAGFLFSKVDPSVGVLPGAPIVGTAASETLTGTDYAQEIRGGDGHDSLIGLGGGDTLDGGAGADTMAGGTGDDTYIVERTGDLVIELAGQGVDTIRTGFTTTLQEHVENLVLTGTAAIHGTGNAANNHLTGNAATNRLSGAEGADTLRGEAGDDTLDGGTGADMMEGGAGDDLYIVDHTGDLVIEDTLVGVDTVEASVSHTLSANVEHLVLTGTDAINGFGNAGANRITGNAAANRLVGNDGADTLDGGAGADTMVGGAGDDVYYVDHLEDRIIESAGEGTDLIYASVTYVMPNHVERLVVVGGTSSTARAAAGAGVDITGNALDNRITGNDGANWLRGAGGNDFLDGNAGPDTLEGGVGDDAYYIDTLGDTLIERWNEGWDSVFSTLNARLGENFEQLNLVGAGNTIGYGNDGDNRLIGGDGNNRLLGGNGADTLSGGHGADTLDGGAGDDLYIVDDFSDRIIEVANGGLDLVRSSVSHTLANQVENLNLLGTAVEGIGNRSSNQILGNNAGNRLAGLEGHDTLFGHGGADTLLGGAGRDSVSGGDGNDVISGGAGADTVLGGAGRDAFLFGGPGDGPDRVLDFTMGEDIIQVSAAGFGGGLTPGALAAAHFSRGVADDGSPQFIYHNNGVLSWDVDGLGGAAGVTIAILAERPALTLADIQVVA